MTYTSSWMFVQLRAMIRNDMDKSEEIMDREMAIRVAVRDFNAAQATKDEKAIAQAKLHHEQLEAAFRTQMLDERDRREQLLGDFERRMNEETEIAFFVFFFFLIIIEKTSKNPLRRAESPPHCGVLIN